MTFEQLEKIFSKMTKDDLIQYQLKLSKMSLMVGNDKELVKILNLMDVALEHCYNMRRS